MGHFEEKLDILAGFAAADRRVKIDSLFCLLTPPHLKECFLSIKKSKSPGVDGMTVERFERNLDRYIGALARQVHGGRYRPRPMQRFYKKKESGDKRALNIVSLRDTIIHTAVKKILEAVYEVEFRDFSFGFRPGRNCARALEYVESVVNHRPVHHVIDADIKSFFDDVDHRLLCQCLARRIGDRRFLGLVQTILNTGFKERGQYIPIHQGVPQGMVCSPVLANIFLHHLVDLWVERVVRRHAAGFVGMVRYGDDFLIFAQRRDEALAILNALGRNVKRFGLCLSPEKTRFVDFGPAAPRGEANTFDFLGYTHYNDRDSSGAFCLGKRPKNEGERPALTAAPAGESAKV
jgi:group II intron reverse transcriptase/maturase